MATNDNRTERNRARAAIAGACLLLLGAAGTARAQSAETATVPSPEAGAAATTDAEASATTGARVLSARVKPRRAYYYGLKPVRLEATIGAKGPTDLRFDIVRDKTGALERSIARNDVPPRTPVSVTWDGLSGAGTAVRGKMRLVIRGASGEPIAFSRRAVRAAGNGKKKARSGVRFGFFDHIFPVRAKHTYGDGIGAPRGDHTHQGQDISAACGAKLVAAQGGTVQVNAYQAGGAGYYMVIDSVASDVDHVYMHMAYASAIPVGSAVRTGQTIGQVGNTGSSSGCHLHFEMWSGPGWYEGGTFLDPTPSMRAWDKYS
jgi:murein DD-endopeptidase MepM/ murein hydrolase activator NlpD